MTHAQLLLRTLCLASSLLMVVPAAKALCIYNGKHFERSRSLEFEGRLYARTTLRDEFADSAVAIRCTVLSSREVPINNTDPNGAPGVEYRVKVNETFKGRPPRRIIDYSDQDSGGFYLNVGTQYLLFLDPVRAGASGTFRVNYSCGQSRPWSDVSPSARKQLNDISAKQD